MNSIVYPICALGNLIAFGYKLRVLRTDRSPTQWALCGTFFIPFVIFVASTPAVWVAISNSVGIVNASGLLTQGLVMLVTACQQMLLLHLTYERTVAWRKAIPRLVAIGAALVLMTTLFFSETWAHEAPTHFALTAARTRPTYLFVYIAAYTLTQIDVCVLCWRHARISPRIWLRRGLRLIALTLPAALLYAGCRVADIIAGQLHVSGKAWEPLVPLALVLDTAGKTVGWTMPDWGRYLTSARELVARHHVLRTLLPLHRELTAHIPQAVLELVGHEDIKTRLYRTVVEIRDAQWALRLWMTPEMAATARRQGQGRGFHGDDLLAFIEASMLKRAVEAKARGVEPADHAVTPRLAEPQDLAAELRFQRRLAMVFFRSPVSHSSTPATDIATTHEKSA